MTSPSLRAYRSGASLAPNTPDTITITAGTSPPQTWTLPKPLLAQRCHVFRLLFAEDTTISSKSLPSISATAFANFTAYLRSSIYAPNTQTADYNALHTHMDACILGAQLGADDYRKAALRALHALFAPLARSPASNATRSMLRPPDLQYVCERAGAGALVFAPGVADTHAMLRGLRALCFDALAAHWSLRNVAFLTAQSAARPDWRGLREVPRHKTGLRWATLLERFPELRHRLLRSVGVEGEARSGLLRRVEDYFLVFGDIGVAGESDEAGSSSSGDGEGESWERSEGSVEAEQAAATTTTTLAGDEDSGGGVQIQRPRLTLKLRGAGNGLETGRAEEESRAQPDEEDMKPVYTEDIDAVGEEDDIEVVIKLESDEENVLTVE